MLRLLSEGKDKLYWLFDEDKKESIRDVMTELVDSMPKTSGADHKLQLFPFVGRKDLNQARTVIRTLSKPGDLVADPFMGTGTFGLASGREGRSFVGNEWEPYTYRQMSSIWEPFDEDDILLALEEISRTTEREEKFLYWTRCTCGNDLVTESLFFDLSPLEYRQITKHERLGKPGGQNVVFRRKLKCAKCGSTSKFFDDDDAQHLTNIENIPLESWARDIFDRELIENSRINLSSKWTIYGSLFPHRSKLALSALWKAIHSSDVSEPEVKFLEDAFLTVLPLAKYKDYRSKSQDLHVPSRQLRESNVFVAFREQVKKRIKRLSAISLSDVHECPELSCSDFRDYFGALSDESIDLVVTDPPWNDGNAYFEKAQLYHPWLDFDLSSDQLRLEREVVVTDAPSRSDVHDEDRWWRDVEEVFENTYRVLKTGKYFAMYFRPIKAVDWVSNLNSLKLIARRCGFEPLLTVDVSSSDPSMRKQQSASFAFSKDMVFVFVKLPPDCSRVFIGDVDVDYLAFRASVDSGKKVGGAFSWSSWRVEFIRLCREAGCYRIFSDPKFAEVPQFLFNRYSRINEQGLRIARNDTPYDALLFDTPIEERLFAFVPQVISSLAEDSGVFTFADFLLGLATFVENGTRSLIGKVSKVNLISIMTPYVEEIAPGLFSVRSRPKLPEVIASLMELDPLQFEQFTAELFRRLGYSSVAVVGGSGDRGVDVMAIDDLGQSVVIQCKRYLHAVGSEPIQRLHSFSVTRGVDRRIVVTTSSFTPQAEDEAENTNTELIDGDELAALVPEFFHEWTGLEG